MGEVSRQRRQQTEKVAVDWPSAGGRRRGSGP
jgi:hypothetical protein